MSRLLVSILTVLCLLTPAQADESPFVVVLGVAQDAGYPQAGCRNACCADAWNEPASRRYATSLAVVDPKSKQRWLLECTPDFREQLRLLDSVVPPRDERLLDGILLTHAHIGHYSGMIHLGREVTGTRGLPVYAMPRMRAFLTENGPWSQLVTLKNIELRPLNAGAAVRLNNRLSVRPLVVPHRDEFSETVGFVIRGPKRSALFLPDIDKWSRWKTPVEDVIRSVDIAWVDGTFFANGEIPGRDMSQIPHPFISESLARFSKLEKRQRSKIRFIHFNHTNPALRKGSSAQRLILEAGCGVAQQGERESL